MEIDSTILMYILLVRKPKMYPIAPAIPAPADRVLALNTCQINYRINSKKRKVNLKIIIDIANKII